MSPSKLTICRVPVIFRSWSRVLPKAELPGSHHSARSQRAWWSEGKSPREQAALPDESEARSIAVAVWHNIRNQEYTKEVGSKIIEAIRGVLPDTSVSLSSQIEKVGAYFAQLAKEDGERWKPFIHASTKCSSKLPVAPEGTSSRTVRISRSSLSPWILDAVSPNSPVFAGAWTRAEVTQLLSAFWTFPNRVHPSWSIDDALILRGEIERACSTRDLSVALLSVRFAHSIFGNRATGRINRCLKWFLSRIDKEAPHFFPAESANPTWGQSFAARDWRQTAALATMLAYTGRDKKLQSNYYWYFVEPEVGSSTESHISRWEKMGCDPVAIAHILTFIDLYARTFPNTTYQEASQTIINSALTELWSRNPALHRTRDIGIARTFTNSWLTHALSDFETNGLLNSSDLLRAVSNIISSSRVPTRLSKPVDAGFTFSWECRCASSVKLLNRVIGSPGLKKTMGKEFESRKSNSAATYLADWVRRSRALCSSETLDGRDVATMIFLLMSLASSEELRSLADEVSG